MSDASHPTPSRPHSSPSDAAPSPIPDAEDFGTAYGMEMSIDSPEKAAACDEDSDDPLAWMRRWVARHKAR
jgi:hypothetical protein